MDSSVRVDYLADHVGWNKVWGISRISRFFALRRVIRQQKPDVVVSFLTHVNVATLLATRGLGTAVFVSERTYPPARQIGRLLSSLRSVLYRRADAVVMQTEQGLAWLQRECPGSNGAVIGNPVQYPLPCEPPVMAPDVIFDESRKLVISVGRLGPEKGFSDLIRAFSAAAGTHVEWDLVILGEGPERTSLEELREELSLQTRVHLPGRVGNVSDWYHRADIYALTSKFEGFPNALLEAMAHGVAAISLDCDTGPGSIITNGVNGILVDPQAHPSVLAQVLADLMDDSSRRAVLGLEATRIREQCSIDEVSNQWERLFRKTCDTRTQLIE